MQENNLITKKGYLLKQIIKIITICFTVTGIVNKAWKENQDTI